MALSSSGRMVAVQAVGWLGAVFIGAFGFFHASELREFGYTTLGIPRPSAMVETLSKARVKQQNPNLGQGSGQNRAIQSASGTANQASSSTRVELQAGRNGHYHADAEINGRSIGVMVDSGASMVALSYEHAESLGIYVKDSDFTMRSNTANGVIAIAPVMIDRVTIGSITVRNVQAAVSARGVDLGEPLLGMSFLSRLAKVEMNAGRMILQE
jgi:aspartyl protease family protein